jgi:rSAM/selenodomain-associated transferase 1
MAKEPRAGCVKTRLCPPLTPDGAAELYRCFLLDVLDLAAGIAGVDAVVAYAPPDAEERFAELTGGRFALIPQKGEDLGARLENAFGALFSRGYERIAAMSTDSPDLPPEHLADAFARLERDPVVLGPCPDGGYYLIGLTRAVPELFRNMPWSTPEVLPETERRLERLGLGWTRLPAWNDVDTYADLHRLRRDLGAPGASHGRAPRTAAHCVRELQRSHVLA